MFFEHRAQAAALLAEELKAYRGAHPLVLGIPRGGVPMARVIAEALDGELDVVLVRKLRAPGNPEFAIGSVDETGHLYLTAEAHLLGLPDTYVKREMALQLRTLRRQRELYTPVRPPADPAGRTVIVVDDGLATGSTMIAAVRAVRARHASKVVAVAAVAAPQAARRVGAVADEFVALEVPDPFVSVGAHFLNFSAVPDRDVMDALERVPHALCKGASHG